MIIETSRTKLDGGIRGSSKNLQFKAHADLHAMPGAISNMLPFTEATKREELDLVNRMQLEGELEAFNEIDGRYRARLYNFALGRLGNVSEAEDVTQEILLRTYVAIVTGKFKQKDVPLGSWIFRVTKNHIIDIKRRNNFKEQSPGGELSLDVEMSLIENEYNPQDSLVEKTVLEKLERERVLEIVNRVLSRKQREVVLLRFFLGISILETADSLGKAEGTVKALQSQGIAKLRKLLGEELEEAESLDEETKTLRATH